MHAEVFAALAHDLRLEVFRLLVATLPKGMPAGQIAQRLEVPASTLSTHLAQLERVRVHGAAGIAAGAVGVEASASEPVQHGFRQDAACGVAGAKKQDVVDLLRHALLARFARVGFRAAG